MIFSEVHKFGHNSGNIDFKTFRLSLLDINSKLEELEEHQLIEMVGHKLLIDQKKKVINELNHFIGKPLSDFIDKQDEV